jgi:hypothetical protein
VTALEAAQMLSVPVRLAEDVLVADLITEHYPAQGDLETAGSRGREHSRVS